MKQFKNKKDFLIKGTLSFFAFFITASFVVPASFAAESEYSFAALEHDEQWEFLDEYCTECHNFQDYSGGLDFTGMYIDEVPEYADVWETALRKLNGRMMPPPGQLKPSEGRVDEFVAWLEAYLDEAGTQQADVHRVAIHRLNRKEYGNAIHDLFGLEIDAASILPEDGTSDGFDNIADALQVSPAFIDQYISAARVITEQAVGDKTPSLSSVSYQSVEPLPDRAQGGGSQQLHIEGLPLGTRGGMLVEHWFPADGEYALSVADLNLSLWMYNIEFENNMIFTIDGEKIHDVIIGGDEDRRALDLVQSDPMSEINSRIKDIRFTTTAGPHNVGVTFVRRTFAESDDRLQPFLPGTLQDRILSVSEIEIRGPFNPTGLSQTPTRERIFSCYPQAMSEEFACAEEIIEDFAFRAYRRPANEEDMAPLFEFYRAGYEAGGFEEGIRMALTRILASPNFLYRAEITPSDLVPGSIYQLSDLDLASRLSFFLWSSLPDRELLELAVADQLSDPAILEAQVKRMLADPKSNSLASNFAYQWLELAKLDEISPDRNIFPYASGAGDLRIDFIREIELFVDSVFREDNSILSLLNANYSYLNERLALHYGINTVRGNRFRRVELPDSNRYGLLGKGGILMATAYPNRTSPVLRGAWILEALMGTPPPVPPANVEDLAENEEGMPAMTVRERLELHRQNPSCNACHAVMDPLGFALDNFDAVGRWRELDRFTGTIMDPSGVLPSGELINGPDDLRAALLSRPRMFAQAFTEKLLAYALGRTVEAQDMPLVRSIVREAATEDYRFSSVVMNIINSRAFRMKKVPELVIAGVNEFEPIEIERVETEIASN
ncbi:DUF1592 domain-containing protein [Haliea sp. AH-315-K21]|nr:DUF1592 domain-containing protein [Haliea sp. AH-315-K21]